jgi:protease-4
MSRSTKWFIALGFFAITAFLFLGLGMIGALQSLAGLSPEGFGSEKPHLVQYTVSGPIFESEEAIKVFDKIATDENCRGLLLRVESPGGAVGASQEIFHSLRRLKQTKSIPVWVSLGNVAASGGYYIAVAGDTVFANPGTLTGSIGVIAQFPEAEALLKKAGVSLQTIKSGRFKDVGGFSRKATSAEMAYLQEVINDTHGQFVGDVALGRGMDSVQVAQWADGRVFTGRQALSMGLVDTLGGWDMARRSLEARTQMGKDVEWVEYPLPKSRWMEWMEARSSTSFSAASIAQEWIEKLGFSSTLASGLFFLWR